VTPSSQIGEGKEENGEKIEMGIRERDGTLERIQKMVNKTNEACS